MPKLRLRTSDETKPRKRFGCIFGGFLAIGVLLLFLLIFSLITFRSRPLLDAGTFFTPDVIGFVRLRVDAKAKFWQDLARKFARQTPRNEGNSPHPERILSLFTLIFHPQHFLYLYPGEDGLPGFVVVINVKRLSGLISYAMKKSADHNPHLTKIPPPQGLSARCFLLNEKGHPRFIGITSRAIFISDSESRLREALWRPHSRKPPGGLCARAKDRLPPDSDEDTINGFLIGWEKWGGDILEEARDRYVQTGKTPQPFYQVLSGAAIRDISFRGTLANIDTLDLHLTIACNMERDAENLADILQKSFSQGKSGEGINIAFTPTDKTLSVHILVYGLKRRLEKKFRW